MRVQAVCSLFVLMLLFAAAGCTVAGLPEQPTVPGATEEALEQAISATPPERTPTQLATSQPTDPTTATHEPAPPVTVPAVITNEPLNDREAAQIYAAAVRQIYTVDHTFGDDPPQFPLVYIVTTTDDGSLLGAPATEPRELSAELQQSMEVQLADLPFETIWIAHLDEAPVSNSNGSIADGQGIVITLGNILPQADGAVHLPVFMVCGGLCALGKTYVLEQVNSQWQVTGSVGVEIMA